MSASIPPGIPPMGGAGASSVNQQRIIDCLNRATPSFDELMGLLTSSSAANCHVLVPTSMYEKKRYFIASPDDIRAPLEKNFTTTLSNIIATNELRFSPEEVLLLVERLITLNADMTVIDYTAVPLVDSHIANNPLKNLIALGSCSTHFDPALSALIRHIGTLDETTRQTIFDHVDNFFEPMTPLYFLIRQGKEDLALETVRAGMKASIKDLKLACLSFGTSSSERPAGIDLIDHLLFALERAGISLSESDRAECYKFLFRASAEAEDARKDRLKRMTLADWNSIDSAPFLSLLKELNMTKETFIETLRLGSPEEKDRLLTSYEMNILKNDPIDLFSDYYRKQEHGFYVDKYNFVKEGMGRAKLDVLLSIFDPGKTILCVQVRTHLSEGQKLYIRGEGSGLSWDPASARPLVRIQGDLYMLPLGVSPEGMEYKILLNNEAWESGPNHRLSLAEKGHVIEPHF